MNAKTTICTAFMLFSIVAVQPGWAQLIDPATQLRAPVTVPERRLYDLRNPGMNPEVIRPGTLDSARRADVHRVNPTVLEQIGKVKLSMPSTVGVR